MSNVKVIFPDIPVRAAAHTSSATFSDVAPLSNLDDGRRDNNAAVTSSPTEVIINHDLGSGNTAAVDHLVVARADNVTVSGSVMVRGSTVSRFAPSSITGLKLWYDSNRGVTTVSGAVSDWKNQALATNNATQGTAANRPVLSRWDNKENLFRYSEEFNQASAWTLTNATITTNAAVAPDGTTTAEKLVDNTTNGQHLVQQMVKCAPNKPYRVAVYVKAAELTECRVILYDAGSNFYGVNLNLSSGVATVTSGGTVNSSSYTVTDAGSGWYLVTITGTIPSPSSSQYGITINTSSGGVSYAGTGQGIYVWAASLQEASADSSYLKTTDPIEVRGIQGNRSLFFDGTNDSLTSSFGATISAGFTLGMVVKPIVIAGGTRQLVDANSTGGSARFMLRLNATGTLSFLAFNSGTQIQRDTTSTLTAGNTYVLTATYDGTTTITGLKIYIDGVQADTTSSSSGVYTVPTGAGASIQLGGTFSSQFFSGIVGEFIYVEGAPTTTDRQAIEAYLTSKMVTAPVVNISNFNSQTLYGTRAKDFITTFSPSTAYRHWWVEFLGVTAFKPSKIYLGTDFDPVNSPDYSWRLIVPSEAKFTSGSGEIRANRTSTPRYTFELFWEGLTDAEVNTFAEKIWVKKHKSGFFLYTSAQPQILDNKTLVHVRLVSAEWERVGKANYNVLRAVFEEMV